jgi:hyperosmotically inducible periplasmic protein
LSEFTRRVAGAGCAATALCGLLACATPLHRSEDQKDADRRTAERVQNALGADRSIFAQHISVHADNGVVWLTGYVWDPTDIQEATSVASGVEGVKRVVNDLDLELNGIDNAPVSR